MPETRKSFTASKKLEIVEFAEVNENRKAGDILKYPSQISDFGGKGNHCLNL